MLQRHRKRTAREREQNRLAKIRQRARERKRVRLYDVRAGEIVHEALIARNIDAGMSKEAAERAAGNRKKVNADLTGILLQWARRYLSERTGGHA